MPYGITQCYLPLGRGDIPAFTSAEAGTRFRRDARLSLPRTKKVPVLAVKQMFLHCDAERKRCQHATWHAAGSVATVVRRSTVRRHRDVTGTECHVGQLD